ncbi:hypothetical protein [Neobacillus sp. 204]|uniref:hypothetical protein n=1 Tax=Neobacillus sp. 204 TaxID=3383351 RepID=UPI00397C9788
MELNKGQLVSRRFSQMFLRKDATKHIVVRVDELIRKTAINAKLAFVNEECERKCVALQAGLILKNPSRMK